MKHHTSNMHERFLRHIWSKQYLKGRLTVADGRPLTVVDVGTLNPDGGPDFRDAKMKINGVTYTGDVEIHRTAFDWFQHQHQEDPRYNQVVLHVILELGSHAMPTISHSKRHIPVLVLGEFLSESIHSIWQKAILDERAHQSAHIRCYEKNDSVSADLLEHWLSKLAVERLELKLRRYEERLKQLAGERRMTVREKSLLYGEPPWEGSHEEIPPPQPELTQKDFSQKELWEQVLYEGLMDGLGFSKNREPFVRLAQSVTLKKIEEYGFQIGDGRLEALFFGVAGLIPKINSLKEKESRDYVRRIAREWKVLKPSYHSEMLHPADWQFFPTRPSNFPTLRIAAACSLIGKFKRDDLFRRMIQLLKSNLSSAKKEQGLLELLTVESDGFWNHHYTFDTPSKKHVTALGTSRIREITINAILPIALLYARIFKDKAVRNGALDVYQSLPAHEDNSITRLMEKQLLRKKLKLTNVCRQQAVIQLYKFYCSENRCSECQVGISIFH